MPRRKAARTAIRSSFFFSIGKVYWVTDEAQSGTHSIGFDAPLEAVSEWVAVTPGQRYTLSFWYKWTAYAGQQWGHDRILIYNSDWSTILSAPNLHAYFPQDTWSQISLPLVPSTEAIRINFGQFGPQDEVSIYFDHFSLVEGEGQEPTDTPTPTPTATATHTPTPTVTATATSTVTSTSTATTTLTSTVTGTPVPQVYAIHYTYDGDGTLVRIDNGEVTAYLPGAHYEMRTNGMGQENLRKYYFAGSTRVALRENGAVSWLLSDHLGSTSVTANADGTLRSQLRYTAFGETRYASGETATGYRYTGQLSQMGEIGLYYYKARWMDPVTAHFAQADTIVPGPGDPQAYDRYAYALFNPLRYVDPSGHASVPCQPGVDIPECGLTTGYTDKLMLTYLIENEVTGGDVDTKFGAPNTLVLEKHKPIPSDPVEYLDFIRQTREHTGRPYGTHPGIDKGSTKGNRVYAVAPGTITAIVPFSKESAPGYYMIIKHVIAGTSYYAVYFHLQDDENIGGLLTDKKSAIRLKPAIRWPMWVIPDHRTPLISILRSEEREG